MFEGVNFSLSQFHFLQPLWLLALIPLALVYGLTVHKASSGNDWNKVIDVHLLPTLLAQNANKTGKSFSLLLMLAWLISVLALANPAWDKQAVPVFQTNTARVIVLDLSRSMDIADVKPSRLARAKFKIKDILARQEEGQTGLVVFAGDAFIVTPLTRDTDTINSLLSALTTRIMPVQGSRADLGLLKAQELLQQAGVAQGQVLLMADGANKATAVLAAEELQENGYNVSVLSIGTKQGGGLPNVSREKPIVVGVQEKALQQIADEGGGRYKTLSTDSSDIDNLLTSMKVRNANEMERADDVNSNEWKSKGPLLVLLLLPLAALAFRRGWLLSIGLVLITFGQPQPVMADSGDRVWDSLWTRQDQQADQALQSGDYEQAQRLAEDPLRRGSAAFKKGDYDQALSDFSKAEGADAAYNKGNALAKLERYKEAIKAYNEALKQRPDMKDAVNNKALIEAFLKKEKEKEKQDQNDKEDKEDNQEQGKDNNQQQSQDQNKQSSQQEKGQESKPDEKGQKSEQTSKENEFAKANKEANENKEEKEKDQENREQAEALSNKDNEEIVNQEDEKQVNAKQNEDAQEEIQDKTTQQAQAESLSKEEKIAAEQWLRRIEDDPGELLKRKFRYQYKRRRQSTGSGDTQPW